MYIYIYMDLAHPSIAVYNVQCIFDSVYIQLALHAVTNFL